MTERAGERAVLAQKFIEIMMLSIIVMLVIVMTNRIYKLEMSDLYVVVDLSEVWKHIESIVKTRWIYVIRYTAAILYNLWKFRNNWYVHCTNNKITSKLKCSLLHCGCYYFSKCALARLSFWADGLECAILLHFINIIFFTRNLTDFKCLIIDRNWMHTVVCHTFLGHVDKVGYCA